MINFCFIVQKINLVLLVHSKVSSYQDHLHYPKFIPLLFHCRLICFNPRNLWKTKLRDYILLLVIGGVATTAVVFHYSCSGHPADTSSMMNTSDDGTFVLFQLLLVTINVLSLTIMLIVVANAQQDSVMRRHCWLDTRPNRFEFIVSWRAFNIIPHGHCMCKPFVVSPHL